MSKLLPLPNSGSSYNANMTHAIFFCSGIVVGLAIAVPIIMIFWQGAHRAAQVKVQSDFIERQAAIANAEKKVNQSIDKLRAMHPDMTREQEQEARNIFISRYTQPPTSQKPVPVSKD